MGPCPVNLPTLYYRPGSVPVRPCTKPLHPWKSRTFSFLISRQKSVIKWYSDKSWPKAWCSSAHSNEDVNMALWQSQAEGWRHGLNSYPPPLIPSPSANPWLRHTDHHGTIFYTVGPLSFVSRSISQAESPDILRIINDVINRAVTCVTCVRRHPAERETYVLVRSRLWRTHNNSMGSW